MFKIFGKNCCGLDVHKTWIYACIGMTDGNGLTTYKQERFSSFSKGLRKLSEWLAKYNCTDVCMESAGKYWIPVFNILEKGCKVTLSHPKYTKPQKGNKTDRKDAKWIYDLFMCDMIKPSFIPPPDIRNLRDLVRYRFKLTNMLTGEKNRALNCLTVSNLKLDNVFFDVFGKSSTSIINYILEHPGGHFDVSPFVHKGCKQPIEEIQSAVDGSISPEQAAKLKEILNHIDELNTHKLNIESEILSLALPHKSLIDLISTVSGFSSAPMTAIALLSEIGADMSVFPTAKNLCSWAGCCPRNDQSGGKRKSSRISRAGVYLKPLLVQVANLVILVISIVGLFYLIVWIGTPIGAKGINENLWRVGLVDHAGESPILIRTYREKEKRDVTIMEFESNIPYPEWEKQRAKIETALNINCVDVKQGNNKQRILLYTVSGSSNLPQRTC